MVQLDVDSEVNHVVGPLNPKPVDHREPVFVGGVPGKHFPKGQASKSRKTQSALIIVAIILKIEPCIVITPKNIKGFICSNP